MKNLVYLLLLAMTIQLNAQEGMTYQKPSQEILDLVDVQMAPSVLMDDAEEFMIFLSRNQYKTIAELSKEELRLGGLRIDPQTNISSRARYINKVAIRRFDDVDAEPVVVKNLPENAQLTNFTWSPDQSKIAMTNTTASGVELWVLDIEKAEVTRLMDAQINANLGDVINWFKDSQSMLVKILPENRQPLIDTESAVPTGPTISVSDGEKAQNRQV